MNRREFVIGAVVVGAGAVLAAGVARALPKKAAPLEVTYYYLPG